MEKSIKLTFVIFKRIIFYLYFLISRYYGNRGSINKMDSLNNNEQITVQSPTIGIWNVKVQSKALPFSGSQKFSIAITSFGNVNLNVE